MVCNCEGIEQYIPLAKKIAGQRKYKKFEDAYSAALLGLVTGWEGWLKHVQESGGATGPEGYLCTCMYNAIHDAMAADRMIPQSGRVAGRTRCAFERVDIDGVAIEGHKALQTQPDVDDTISDTLREVRCTKVEITVMHDKCAGYTEAEIVKRRGLSRGAIFRAVNRVREKWEAKRNG